MFFVAVVMALSSLSVSQLCKEESHALVGHISSPYHAVTTSLDISVLMVSAQESVFGSIAIVGVSLHNAGVAIHFDSVIEVSRDRLNRRNTCSLHQEVKIDLGVSDILLGWDVERCLLRSRGCFLLFLAFIFGALLFGILAPGCRVLGAGRGCLPHH